MTNRVLDIVTSILQVWLFFTVINKFTKNKMNFIQSVKITVPLFICIVLFTNVFGNLSICVFLTHIASLGLIAMIYRKKRMDAIIAYTAVYILFALYSIFFGNLFYGYISPFISQERKTVYQILIMYMPEYILIILGIIKIDKFIIIQKSFISKSLNTFLIIISFILDFVIAFYMNIYGTEVAILKNIIILLCALFFIIITVYFNNVQKKSDQIFSLNNALEAKNNDLSKLKHDYGAQISYLYGLHLMKRYEDLGKALKDIIERNGSISSGVEVSYDENSFLSMVLRPAIEKGIHVIIDENSDTDLSYISEIDLYRILSNIISNAIRAMNGQGIIVAETYDTLKNTVIKIENNGPKIPQENLENIFKEGFTTKDNNDKNHGYGLNIVKELVEKYNGKINVRSSGESTEFKIIFPI